MGRKKGRTIAAYEKDQRALELRKEGHSKVKSQPIWELPGQVYPANSFERQLSTEGMGQMLRDTPAHTPERGGGPWQDHVQA